MLGKIAITAGTLLLMLLLTVSAALGVWAYSLHGELAQARSEIQVLKTSNEKLQQDYADLNTGSGKTSSELAAAQSRIESLQSQLTQEQADGEALKQKLVDIRVKVHILYAWQFSGEESFDATVEACGDAKLKELWEKYTKTHSNADAWKVGDYIVQSIADLAGWSASPAPSAYSG